MNKEIFYTKKNINDISIAILSDIHYYTEYNVKIFNNLIKQLNTNKPNYITIVGDILDSSNITNMNSLKEFLNKIVKIAPTIVVLGNHDEKTGYMHHWSYKKNQELISLLNSIDNLYLLDDSNKTFNNINFYGFNLSYKYYEENKETYDSFCQEISNLNCNILPELYNITLIHTPINIYKYIKNNPNHQLNNSDLILSGHMHNGCLPFILSYPLNKLFHTTRGILSPIRKFFPKYSHGRVYERDGYIYQGITKLSHSTKLLHKLDFLFKKKIEFIHIKKRS